MTKMDHCDFFSSPSGKNGQDETRTADDQHLAFLSES